MKRISFLMVALLLMGGMAMAQSPRRGGGDKNMDPKARAERMTARMAKEYSLNDTQKKQLLEANMAMFGKVGECPDGAKSEMQKGKKDKCAQGKDNCCSKKEGKKVSKEDREKMRSEMKASREAYDAQLKKILTKEQYDSYIKKQTERQQRMNDGQRRK